MKKMILFLLVTTSFYAQELTVFNNQLNEPIDNVAVKANSTKKVLYTNKLGKVILENCKDDDLISFHNLEYETLILSYKTLKNINFIVYLYPNSFSLDEVLVSLTKNNQIKKNIPNAIFSIQKAGIEFQNPQTSADVLQQTGKVFIQKSQLGGGSPMIRGFSTNRVLLNVDGVRMNNAIFRSGNLQNVISIDALSLKNIEVILGPGSVIYGSDAIGGVMSYYTKDALVSDNDKTLIKSTLINRYSSANNEKTTHIDANFGLKKWGFFSSFTFSDFDDLKAGTHGNSAYLRPDYIETINGIDVITQNSNPQKQISSGYHQTNFLQKILFKPSENLDISYNLHFSETSDYSRYDRLLRRRNNGKLRSAEWYYGPQKWTMHHLKSDYKKETKIFDRFETNIAYQYFQESRHDRDFNTTKRYNYYEKLDAYSANFDFFKQLTTKQKITYGFEYIFNKVHSTGYSENTTTHNRTPEASRYPDGSTWQSVAAYLQYENKLNKKLTLQSGVRFNQVWLDATFDKTFYNFPFEKAETNTSSLIGSVGFAYNPTEKLSLFSTVSTAFRSPNIDDVGKIFESSPGSVVVPNDDLVSEYAWNGEIGLQKKFKNTAAIDVSAYYTYMQDALVRRDYLFNGSSTLMYQGELSNVQAIQNAAYALSYGFQGSFQIDFLPNLQWKTTATLNKGYEELDNGTKAPLRHSPPFFGTSHLVFKIQKFTVDFSVDYNSKIEAEDLAPSEVEKPYMYALTTDGKPYQPEWYTLHLKTQWAINKIFTANFGIENLTDQLYRPYSSGISAAGRNFIGSLKISL